MICKKERQFLKPMFLKQWEAVTSHVSSEFFPPKLSEMLDILLVMSESDTITTPSNCTDINALSQI